MQLLQISNVVRPQSKLITTRTETDFLVYDRTLGVAAMEFRGFYYPVDMAINEEGRIYGLNRSHEGDPRGVRICMFDYDSNYFGSFGSVGEEDGQFTWATSIAIDREGLVYVADEYTDRISIFDSEGNYLRKWGEHGDTPGQMDGPASMAFDHDDNLFISDHRNNRIQKFTKDGRYISSFGKEGDGDGEFNLPWGVTVSPSGDLYVVDWRNDRIQRFTSGGEFKSKYLESGSAEGQLNRPASVAVDKTGHMYVADWGNDRVQVFDPDGGFVMTLEGQATVSPWAQEFLDASPTEAAARYESDLRVALNARTGGTYEKRSHIEHLFWAPISIKLDLEGRIYVTDRNRHRVQVYRRV